MSSPNDVLEMLRQRQLQQALMQASGPPPAAPEQEPPDMGVIPRPDTQFVTPPEATFYPATRAYESMIGTGPQLSQYKPSFGRRLGGILAGIGTGILTRNPLVGMEMNRYVKEGPFAEQQRQFQQRLGEAEKKSGVEIGEAESTAKIGELGERRRAEVSRAGAEKARESREAAEERALRPGTSEFTGKEEITRLQHPESAIFETKDTFTGKLKDGTPVDNLSRVHDKAGKSIHYMGDDGTVYTAESFEPGSLQPKMKLSGSEPRTSIAMKYRNYLMTNNYQTPPPELVDQWEAESAQARETPALKEERTATAKLNVKRAEGATPQEIEQFRNFASTHPEQAMDYAKGYSDIKRRDLLAAVPIQVIPPAADKVLVDAAQITLQHAKTLRELIDDPQIQANLGPILGRIQDFEGNWGGNPTGLVDPEKEQELLSFIKMNMLREARLLGGNRPAWQVIQLLRTSSPSAKQIYQRFLGALDAEERGAQNTMEGILGPGKKKEEVGDEDIKIITRGGR